MARLKPPTYHVSGLAVALGVDQALVSRWKAAGMPFRNAKISMAGAVQWLREHERRERPQMGAAAAQRRREAAQAEREELKLAKERGDVVLAVDVIAAAEDEAAHVAGILSQLPTEFAPLLATRIGCSLRAASAVLREISDRVRTRLASDDGADEAAA